MRQSYQNYYPDELSHTKKTFYVAQKLYNAVIIYYLFPKHLWPILLS